MRHFLFVLVLYLLPVGLSAQIKESPAKVFRFELIQQLPGTPQEVFDGITGDISPWWDHSFSDKPLKFFIEPKPGGRFLEIFNEQGEGVLHATVTAARRGELLRMDGPLGLAGRALHMVTSYHFKALGNDSTQLKVEVHLAGEIDRKTAEIVQNVWRHFIIDRFAPWWQRQTQN